MDSYQVSRLSVKQHQMSRFDFSRQDVGYSCPADMLFVCVGGGPGEDEGAVVGHINSETGVSGPAAAENRHQTRYSSETLSLGWYSLLICFIDIYLSVYKSTAF